MLPCTLHRHWLALAQPIIAMCCVALLLTGCGTKQKAPSPQPQPTPTNTIFASSRPDAPPPFTGEGWVILPADPGLDPGDIMFQRFTKALQDWLQQHGRRVVARPEEADTALFLGFDQDNGNFLGFSGRPQQIPLAPVNGQARALQVWVPLNSMPGYYKLRPDDVAYLFLHAAPLVRRQGELFVAEPMWTVILRGGKGLFPPLPNAAKQLVGAIEGLPGTNK